MRRFSKDRTCFDGDKYTKTLDCWQQLIVLLYAQIKDFKSLREIIMSISSHRSRWIKQNLKIKTFIGIGSNAVMTQVWVAIILYLLLSLIKFQTRFKSTLSDLLRIIREVMLESKSLIEYLSMN